MLYDGVGKNISHLFLHCPYVQPISISIRYNLHTANLPGDVLGLGGELLWLYNGLSDIRETVEFFFISRGVAYLCSPPLILMLLCGFQIYLVSIGKFFFSRTGAEGSCWSSSFAVASQKESD